MRTTRKPTKVEFNAAVKRAKAYYHDHIKHQLTDADKGRYIAIDGNTYEWEIADTDICVEVLRSRVPDAIIYMVRHIIIVSEFVGGAPYDDEELIRDDDAKRMIASLLAQIRQIDPERAAKLEQ